MTKDDQNVRELVKMKPCKKVLPGNVLDFGGGTGLDLPWLVQKYRVFFLEPSEKMRSIALKSVVPSHGEIKDTSQAQGIYHETFIHSMRSNITLNKILAAKRLVIGDMDSAKIEDIYFLGSHHCSAPPPIGKLPFDISESASLRFPVPDFVSSYMELEKETR